MKFYIADCHFDHGNIIHFDNRPFKTVDEMNEEVVGKLLNWYQNGADSTTGEFYKCDKDTQKEIANYVTR